MIVTIPRLAIFAFVILLITLGLGVFVSVYLPKATIVISPPNYEREVTREILLSSTASAPDFVKFILPAKVIDKTTEERNTIQRTSATVTEDFARGTVTLTNKQNEEQPLLPKSHLRHEATGIYFLTDKPVRIPPQGSIEVTVTAEEKGKAGNVPSGKFIIDRLPVSTQAVIYGESLSSFSGGESADSPLSQDEIDKAVQDVVKKSQEKAQIELSSATGGAPLRPDLVAYSTEEQGTSVELGSKATSFEVYARTRARAFMVDDKDLLSLTLLALRASPTADEEFVQYKPESFKVELLKTDFERGEAKARGHLTGIFTKKTPPTVFDANNLAGRTEKEVKEYLSQQDGIGEVNVKFSPFWVKTVPARKGATTVQMKGIQ